MGTDSHSQCDEAPKGKVVSYWPNFLPKWREEVVGRRRGFDGDNSDR